MINENAFWASRRPQRGFTVPRRCRVTHADVIGTHGHASIVAMPCAWLS